MKKLLVVGIGPGEEKGMTGAALAAMQAADLLCGYTAYIDLVRPLLPQKQLLATPMTREVERCRAALNAANEGKTVAMVCSGDAGIYGMAGLCLQLGATYPDVDIEVVPGVSAAMAGAAVLGAPLMHDFAVVSLSDLLTPWQLIEKRLAAAAMADFVLCLYNPASKKRTGHLARACGILRDAGKDGGTVCGWVRNIGRPGQQCGVMTLDELKDWQADMFTTVYIGNSATRVINGRMVTPRGYEAKL